MSTRPRQLPRQRPGRIGGTANSGCVWRVCTLLRKTGVYTPDNPCFYTLVQCTSQRAHMKKSTCKQASLRVFGVVYRFGRFAFQDRRLRPLGHPSKIVCRRRSQRHRQRKKAASRIGKSNPKCWAGKAGHNLEQETCKVRKPIGTGPFCTLARRASEGESRQIPRWRVGLVVRHGVSFG